MELNFEKLKIDYIGEGKHKLAQNTFHFNPNRNVFKNNTKNETTN